MKKIISLLVAFLLLISCAVVAQAGEPANGGPAKTEDGFWLSVVPFNDESTKVNWYYSEALGTYCLFLPAGTDRTALKLECSATEICVGDTLLQNGTVTGVFSAGTDFTVRCGIHSYPLKVLVSASIPAIYITTESGSLDSIHANKENKEKGTLTIVENGKVTESKKALKSIKGRGNSTWTQLKKPYNIKFDKGINLFGMGKAKKWSLLANYLDDSLIRNQTAFDLATYLGLPFTPEYQAIDLYINDNYMGNYLVCESVEVNDERVDITDLDALNEEANPGVDFDACTRGGTGENGTVPSSTISGSRKWINIQNNPGNITGGYLLEFDFANRYNEEICGFVTTRNQSVTVKSPEYASQAEVNYIADYYQQAEDALFSPDGKNALGKHYSEYFDMASLVKMYMLLEYTMCTDAGTSSCYFYKNADDNKLYAGPAWDFDYSLQNPKSSLSIMNTNVWQANTKFYPADTFPMAASIDSVFSRLCCHEDFISEVVKQWPGFAAHISQTAKSAAGSHITSITASALMNAIRWDIFSKTSVSENAAAYKEAADVIVNYSSTRVPALNKGFGVSTALVRYLDEQFHNYFYLSAINVKGDKIILPESNRVPNHPDNYIFVGWNTKADGTGRAFRPGEEVTLDNRVNVFYAQWKIDTPVAPAYILGDVDNDVKISAADARLALRAAVGLENFAAASREFLAADVDRSGKVDAADARTILRVAVGLDKFA